MLSLRLVSAEDPKQTTIATREFLGGRLTIGRRPNENDWHLKDGSISRQHCEIFNRGSKFYLKDVSSGGVFVNRSQKRVPKDQVVEIAFGDRLQIGPFAILIEASVAAEPKRKDSDFSFDPFEEPSSVAEDAPEISLPDAPSYAQRPSPPPAPAASWQDDDDWGESASDISSDEAKDDLSDWGNWDNDPKPEPSSKSRGPARLDDAFPGPIVSSKQIQRHAVDVPGNWDPADSRGPDVLKAVTGGRSGPLPVSEDTSFYAFLEGAALEAKDFGGCDPAEVMRAAGAAYRQAILGLTEVLKDRALTKTELRLARTVMQTVENNPMKFLPTQKAAVLLLNPGNSGFMGAEEAIKLACEDVKKHHLSLIAGMRAAVRAVLGELRPAKLEARLNALPKFSVLAGGGKDALAWKEYRAFYERFCKDADDSPSSVANVEFRKGYDEQQKALS